MKKVSSTEFVLFGALFLSGVLGLIYEVLWMKQLTLLFGNGAYASAITLAVFFLGLGLGSFVWGRRVSRLQKPILLYVLLEFGIALCVLVFSVLFPLFLSHYAAISSFAHENTFLVVFLKCIVATILIFPAAFCMGGTLPAFSEIVVVKKLSRSFSILYAINTFGAVVGAFLAGFLLPIAFGFRLSYEIGIILNCSIGFVIWYLFRNDPTRHVTVSQPSIRKSFFKGPIVGLVFLSGAITLSLEVLWTRLFAQILLNDTYSFSMVITVFLISIAISGVAAHKLARRESPVLLRTLFITSGIIIGISLFLFIIFTGYSPFQSQDQWILYLFKVFFLLAIIILIPIVSIGSVLPYGIQKSNGDSAQWETQTSYLLFINTLGSLVGSLVAGFVLIPTFGVWRSITLIGALCILTGFLIQKTKGIASFVKDIPVLCVCILVFAVIPAWIRPAGVTILGESIKKVWEGKSGTVSVLEFHPTEYMKDSSPDMYIRVNGSYNLGGLRGIPDERRMTQIAYALHPDAKSVFYIGLGTGITAGAAIPYPFESITVTELMPEVIEASHEYFKDYVNNLYDDKRVTVIANDGRNALLESNKTYDLIIGDLFYPWDSGAGSLYTTEQFRLVQKHLNSDGIFVQWLPLHQLTEYEFGVMANTFMSVFPQVVLWRDNFYSEQPIVAFVGYNKPTVLDPHRFIDTMSMGDDNSRLDTLLSVRGESVIHYEDTNNFKKILPQLSERLPLTFYGGNITESRSLYEKYPINTDDKPLIEFNAPKNASRARSGETTWLTNQSYRQLMDNLAMKTKPDDDPYLKDVSSVQKEYVKAGMSFVNFSVFLSEANMKESDELVQKSDYWFTDYLQKTKLEKLFPSQ